MMLYINNSMKSKVSEEELSIIRQTKIRVLHIITAELIYEKYPIHKQLNNKNDVSMKLEINKIRSICSAIESKIENMQADELYTYIISERVLRKKYSI